MWIDDDRLTQEGFDIGTYPKKCPICGKDSIHLLMYRPSEMSTNGTCWIWCSSCEKYSHMNVTIPDWWDNYNRLGSDKLFASPEHNIDDERENIDKWVNKLINEKVDTPEEEPKSINDDKTLYVIKINTQKILTEEKAELAAQLCRCDKEQAINMIENQGFELYPMPAADISLVKKELEFKKFDFTVSPEYKW